MISIVVCRDRTAGLFWDALTEELRRNSRFSVTTVETVDEVHDAITELGPGTLICGGDLQISHRELFRANPDLAILRIDEESAKTILRTSQSIPVETRVSLDDADYSLFVDVIDRLFPAAGFDDKPQLRLVDDPGRSPAIQLAQANNMAGQPSFDTQKELDFDADMRRWVELVLVERLSELLPESGEAPGRVTGWGLSAADAIRLLGVSPDQSTQDLLAEARQRSEGMFWNRERQVNCRFHWFASVFSLTILEQQLVVLLLAPEVDGRFAQVMGCLNDDMNKRHSTLATLTELPLLAKTGKRNLMQYLFGDSTLPDLQIVGHRDEDTLPLSEVPLVVAKDVLHYLIGTSQSNTDTLCTFHAPSIPGKPGRSTKPLRARLKSWIAHTADDAQPATLNIDASPDNDIWFKRGAGEIGLGVVELDLSLLAEQPASGVRRELLITCRRAALFSAAIMVNGIAALSDKERDRLGALAVEVLSPRAPLLAIIGRLRSVASVRSMSRLSRQEMDATDRAEVWQDYADRLDIALDEHQARELGSWARFSELDIEQTLYFARDKVMDLNLFKKAARHVSTTGIPPSVRRIAADFSWDDIVLPDTVTSRLKQIPDHVTHREKVLTEWGYRERLSYGLGTACLFSGPSGTGKTMASQIIARAIGDAEIFQCDLAKTVSKYIGESEKNLDAIFDAAEKSRAVLVFDEADVLFGKRTEIRDAHDRYANLEVGYLLQRMEAYEGLVILTTNSRSSIDTSFLRRLRFIVEFPIPSASDRSRIWQRVFPRDLPRDPDVNLGYLAQQLDLTGGHIQQIAVMAAYAAAAEGTAKVHMRHVIAATRDELAKVGMDSAQRILDEVAA